MYGTGWLGLIELDCQFGPLFFWVEGKERKGKNWDFFIATTLSLLVMVVIFFST